jgi:NAD-dependent dihydropyrimidine dehydrogenase PreA subunit
MTYVIVDSCIGTKDNSCIDVCPVDCIHPTPEEPGYNTAEQLFIDPVECIDCGACVEVCPVEAPVPDDSVPAEYAAATARNAAYFGL